MMGLKPSGSKNLHHRKAARCHDVSDLFRFQTTLHSPSCVGAERWTFKQADIQICFGGIFAKVKEE
jgi:hypothetical protein